MNFKFTSVKAYTLLTAGSILHNAEEAFTMKGLEVKSSIAFIQPPTYSQFLVAVSILTIAVAVAYIVAIRSKNPKIYLFISTAVAAALLFNVIVPHLVGTIYNCGYTPGVAAAVLLNLPFSLAVLVKNKPLFADRKQMLRYIMLGMLAGYFLFAAVMGLVKILF